MKEEPVESIEYKDYQINIYRDTEECSPREDNDYTSHFWNNSRSNSFDSKRESSIENIITNGKLDKEWLDEHIYVPVYLYDHSGQTISTTPFCDRWDSGLFGLLAESKYDVRKEFGVKRISKKLHNLIINRLKAEVKEVDDWLTGEVYGYTITPIGDLDDVRDSCWNFVGDYRDENNDILLEGYAKPMIDSLVETDNEIAERERQRKENESCEFWSGTNAA